MATACNALELPQLQAQVEAGQAARVGDNISNRSQAIPKRRLASELRRDQLLDVAARLTVEQGFLPLPFEGLAREAAVSKALIYAYFPTQYDLFNALLTRELETLNAKGLDDASRGRTLKDAAVECVMIYFEHVVHWGPLLHVLFSDLYMAGRYDRQALIARDRVVRRVARLARTHLGLPAKEIVAGINMVLAIPEEAGTLAFTGEVEMTLAREMCRTLTLSALKGLKSGAARA
jgi:AcrR family transcriptional regulator